jgi:hypothetical protein
MSLRIEVSFHASRKVYRDSHAVMLPEQVRNVCIQLIILGRIDLVIIIYRLIYTILYLLFICIVCIRNCSRASYSCIDL